MRLLVAWPLLCWVFQIGGYFAMPLPLLYPPLGRVTPADLPDVKPEDPDIELGGAERPIPILLGALSLGVVVLFVITAVTWVLRPARHVADATLHVPVDLLSAAMPEPVSTDRFDRAAATRALDMAAPKAARQCGIGQSAGQTAPIEVVFSPAGGVSSVRMPSGALAGSREAACFCRVMEQTPAAPFSGPALTLLQSVPLHALSESTPR